MQVLIREGSAARNLDAIVKGIVEHHTDTSSFCFCTDDKHIEEIRKEGHINYNVKRAVQLGLPVEKALQMATIQPARCYGLYRLGMIAPGRDVYKRQVQRLRNEGFMAEVIGQTNSGNDRLLYSGGSARYLSLIHI